MINIRKSHPVFAGNKTQFLETAHPNVLGYIHWQDYQGLLVLANFSEHPQQIDMVRFRTYGMKMKMRDLISAETVSMGKKYTLQPYQLMWLMQK